MHYMSIQGVNAGFFFVLKNGNPLTKLLFTARIRDALHAIGLPKDNVASHSFWIGAATAAAYAGIEDLVIRTIRRWLL